MTPSTTTALVPLNVIRTETVLSRLPIHNLSKKGQVQIHITVKNAQGQVELSWQVSPNLAFGAPRQLAYKLDTLVINKKLEELGRPLPKLIRLGSMRQIGDQLGFSIGKAVTDLRKAAHQNAGAYIIATLHYTATDGTERTLEAGFTRYSVVFTGERLPDGAQADAVYLLLNEPYWEVLNSAPTRPLDYDYLKALPPAAQRCYEILSSKLFTALKYRHPHATLLYSEYCTFSAQQRYADYDHVKKQMYKVHKPHLLSEYLEKVSYEATQDREGHPDWVMSYVPGPKAKAEYAACNARRTARLAGAPRREGRGEETATTSPAAEEALTTHARALLQHFHQRFHGTPDAPPSAKALTQASSLMARYGLDQARHIVDFSYTAAHETDYRPQTFGGILQYAARARADYAQAQERKDAAAREREARHTARCERRHAASCSPASCSPCRGRVRSPPAVPARTGSSRDKSAPLGRVTDAHGVGCHRVVPPFVSLARLLNIVHLGIVRGNLVPQGRERRSHFPGGVGNLIPYPQYEVPHPAGGVGEAPPSGLDRGPCTDWRCDRHRRCSVGQCRSGRAGRGGGDIS